MSLSVICHLIPINQITTLYTKKHVHVFDEHLPSTMSTTNSVHNYVRGSNTTMICVVESQALLVGLPCKAEDRLRSLRRKLKEKMICGWLGNLMWNKSSNNGSFARKIRKSSQKDGFSFKAKV